MLTALGVCVWCKSLLDGVLFSKLTPKTSHSGIWVFPATKSWSCAPFLLSCFACARCAFSSSAMFVSATSCRSLACSPSLPSLQRTACSQQASVCGWPACPGPPPSTEKGHSPTVWRRASQLSHSASSHPALPSSPSTQTTPSGLSCTKQTVAGTRLVSLLP